MFTSLEDETSWYVLPKVDWETRFEHLYQECRALGDSRDMRAFANAFFAYLEAPEHEGTFESHGDAYEEVSPGTLARCARIISVITQV